MNIQHIQSVFSQISENALENEIYNAMLRKFVGRLPDSVYLSKYDLSQKIGGTPTHWEDFLRIPAVSQAIEIERNQEIFSAGLKALKRLSEADYLPAEVQGLKSLIDKAEIVKERAQGKTVVVMTYLPNPDT